MKTTCLYRANLHSQADVVVNQGGTSSGKTYSILQVLFTIAVSRPNTRITVAGQDIPNLKAGALRDAKNIVRDTPEFQSMITQYNETERTYYFRSGSFIEFKSYTDEQDARSGKRDYLFVNEANGIPWSVFEQLYIRTEIRTFIDYNPSFEFWAHQKLIGQPNVELLISDYRHNSFVSQKIVEKIEARKDDHDWFTVYGRGRTGKIEGLVFRNWCSVPDLPRDQDGNVTAKLMGYGLDFGFTNDPTALVAVYKQDGELYIDELIYQTNMTNQDISAQLRALEVSLNIEIIADSAEPKSIEELRRERWWVVPAKKGSDSIKASIDVLKRYKLNVTQRSVNLKKELNQYRWAERKKDGIVQNIPVDINNHAIDALRYLALNRLTMDHQAKYTIL